MRISKFILKATDTLVSYLVLLSLCIAGVYAAYALWDNSLVYAAVDDVQAHMLKLKPVIEEEKPSFEDLLAINHDVVGWVTIHNTNMDYPIVQGETNLSYINRDIYGDFALAGSIFLDTRNDRDFNDHYSLLYGHSMSGNRMFGDVNLYKEEAFFNENQCGTLITRLKAYDLRIFASLIVPASEGEIFNPLLWQDDNDDLLDYAEKTGLFLNKDIIEDIKTMDDLQVLALTTCSAEFTDARTVILAVMEEKLGE